jgi:hypothetical protein
VRRLCLALIDAPSLLGRGQLEVPHVDDRAAVRRRLSQGGTLVASPEAIVDHDVVAQLEGPQPDLDEPSLDDVLCRRRILVAVERLYPLVLRETKSLVGDLDSPRRGRLPGGGETHGQEQCRLVPHTTSVRADAS